MWEKGAHVVIRDETSERYTAIGCAVDCYVTMLSAAAIDLSGLPRVPERIDANALTHKREEDRADGFNAALDAIGAPK